MDLGTWFFAIAAFAVLILNYDLVRSNLAQIMIAAVDRNMPPPTSRELDLRPSLMEPGGAGASRSSTVVELRSDRLGHYQAEIEINGRRIDAMVDTGASLIALTYEDAQRIGLYLRDRDFIGRTQTANGIARMAPVMLDRVEIGGIRVQNVQASVAEPGRLKTNLLGMSFLGRLSKFESGAGRMVLHE